MSQYYTSTGIKTDKIPLKDVWENLKSNRIFYDQMDITMSRQLSQKLKAKGYDVKSQAGKLVYVFGITKKAITDNLDGDEA
jgi:hypothetical protein